MIKALIVIPYVDRDYFETCAASLSKKLDVLAIDNTHNNLGLAGSWNKGVKEVEDRYDWLIVMSAAMRFGEAGGLDMLKQLSSHQYDNVVHFAQQDFPEQPFIRGKTQGIEAGNFMWHCTAISKQCLRRVGKFDANFYPIYFEDIDYDLRVQKASGGKGGHVVVPINARSESVGHGVRLGNIKVPTNDLIAYFATKWGSHPSAAKLGTYDRPFDVDNNSLAFWPPAHGELWNE